MGLTAADYLLQLQALLPPGPAWPRADSWAFTRLLAGWADGLAASGAALERLVDEAIPTSTSDLLPDWERAAGLPDACVAALSESQTFGQRRAALVALLSSVGGQTPAYYVAVAAALGYDIAITEHRPHTVLSSVAAPLAGVPWAHAWTISVSGVSRHYWSVLDTVADPLSWGGATLLECVMARLKPAHTTLVFNYL